MKNTLAETYGNNIPSNKIKRIMIPLFTQENAFAVPGLKYFFPENPEIDKYNIVGIEAHLVSQPALALGDIEDSINNIVPHAFARQIYLCLYDQNNEEVFYNFPLRSLFTYGTITTVKTKRIKPITTKLKTRSCYAYIPANGAAQAIPNFYISLSFYYN